MLHSLRSALTMSVRQAISARFGLDHEPVVEVPPRRELGDLAFPAALHLARELRRRPREIATEIAETLELPPGVSRVEIAGAGYLNAFFDRTAFTARLLEGPVGDEVETAEKVVVEHTNINPNKAAHIGHLRNAVLGDVLVRLLRRLGHRVEVQNYIDDTGVQLADVVVGFLDLEGRSREEIEVLPEPFDFTCWDLYARVGAWYRADESRLLLRRETLHALELGEGERSEVGRLVARRIVSRHLRTMRRLGVGYDLLTHESEILARDFFADAFAALKEEGAIHLESSGKNEGCWVMPLTETDEFAGLEDPDKVIVRSDGTVTYVGKDIAYQLWKFGLLGRDFAYRRWEEEEIWQTGPGSETADHPAFGGAYRVINVIDVRQSYLQKIVKAGLMALGHHEQADHSVHFAYEMVALSPKTARQLGLDTDGSSSALEMSGRKGIGVKADDLLDQLVAKSREEIVARNRELEEEELGPLSRAIATAALRFFMVRSGTTRLIAFDFDEALSFEGDSGPYLQYSMVRAANIRRKLLEAGLPTSVTPDEARALPGELWSDDLWGLVFTSAQVGDSLTRAAQELEPALLARYAIDLAQQWNAVYHRHPILHEEDPALRSVRLTAVAIFTQALETVAEVLGIPLPERM